MPPPEHVIRGPLTRAILAEAVWHEKDEFPAHQAWADEIESILPGSGRPLPEPVKAAFQAENARPKTPAWF